MQDDEVYLEFEDAGAILKGHFVLSSGLRSDTYLQCARVMMQPARGERLCRALADKIRASYAADAFDMVVSPAMGGVVVGYEVARQLGLSAVFCERSEGVFTLRRGFDIEDGARVLLVEDVVTTGKSSRETVECIHGYGGKVVAEACLVNRSNGKHGLDFPLISLLDLEVKTYTPDALPLEMADIAPIKPGSRWLKSG
jgi:orotate phosphoribosyltransferase